MLTKRKPLHRENLLDYFFFFSVEETKHTYTHKKIQQLFTSWSIHKCWKKQFFSIEEGLATRARFLKGRKKGRERKKNGIFNKGKGNTVRGKEIHKGIKIRVEKGGKVQCVPFFFLPISYIAFNITKTVLLEPKIRNKLTLFPMQTPSKVELSRANECVADGVQSKRLLRERVRKKLKSK